MKPVPSLLLFAYVFLTVLGVLQGADVWAALATGPLALVAVGVGYMVDVAIFLLLARAAARARGPPAKKG